MRVIMGVWKSKHGVYYVRKKVPAKLEGAVSTVLGLPRPRVSWLKRSLHTKDPREANIKAKPVLIEFDRVLARAADQLLDTPPTASLSEIEIERLAAYQYASLLEEDEALRRDGTGSEDLFQATAKQLREAGVAFSMGFQPGSGPACGLSDREMQKLQESIEIPLMAAKAALARGDVSFLQDDLDELLGAFRINLDRASTAYRQLGMVVLRRWVEALQAIEKRQQGEVVETPRIVEPRGDEPATGATVSAALEGWKKARRPTPMTAAEFEHAARRFTELHGDLCIADITRRHVREFREALQLVPLRRAGALRTASLPQLVEWSTGQPGTVTISAATVNKLLSGVQAVAVWGRDNGLIPEEKPWADPFSRMRLEEEEPEREPWEITELRTLFSSPVFARQARPDGGRGEAAYWLPLLGLYTGARQGELAPLMVANVALDEATGVYTIAIAEDEARGVRVKTTWSRRIVPLHPELQRLGFLQLVQARRDAEGPKATLFPLLRPGPRGGYAEGWSKWFGRYIRSIGITNKARVFHSFRHSFKDALRAAGVSEDVNDALTGHSGGGVGRSYGAKDVLRRFGLARLTEAVTKAESPGLDLSHLYVGHGQS
jgi:integrase